MKHQIALAKLLKEEGDKMSISEIMHVKNALKWWEDDIDDYEWKTEIKAIVRTYDHVMRVKENGWNIEK